MLMIHIADSRKAIVGHTSGMAKAKAYGFSRRCGMTDDILREASGSTLTMPMIGCLPDNVQQAIKSFSIRPGQQHVTFCFPFMAEILRRFLPESYVTDPAMTSQQTITPALFFEQSIEVISGYQSFITLAPVPDRSCMPIVMFTLYQRDSTEGILRHFESLIKTLLDTKTLITVWKMPFIVVDLSPEIQDKVVETCAQTVLDIQAENLLNTFPEKSREDLMLFIKEKMIVPNLRKYEEQFQFHVKEVVSKLRNLEPDRFLAILDHLRSVNCSTVDFQKADMMMKSPNSDIAAKTFWRLWGQDQLAAKVFPMAFAGRSVGKIGPFLYPFRSGGGVTNVLESGLAGLSHVPIKEGLQSIIKCLKAQDYNSNGLIDKAERLKGCQCSVCKSPGGSRFDMRHKMALQGYWDTCTAVDVFRNQSAFYRPTPTKLRLHHTTTPYSDALKAAAILPRPRLDPNELLTPPNDISANLQCTPSAPHLLGSLPPPPFWLQTLSTPNTSPDPMTSSPRMPFYPIAYKPKIISTTPSPSPDPEPTEKS